MPSPETRTIVLGPNDACVIFRDRPETEDCKIDVLLQPKHEGQKEIPEQNSASYLALLATTPFQPDRTAHIIMRMCNSHLSHSAGIDHTPFPEGPTQ